MSDTHQHHAQWKALLEKTFHRKHVKKWREIVMDLLCVDVGLKPGLLWDYLSIQKESMIHLLTTAREKSLLNNSLTAVSIEMDLIIMKSDSLRGDNSSLDNIKAVDVSQDLKIPKVVKNLEKLQKTYEIYKDILKYRNDVSFGGNIFNPTSLFGLMLGYPVIYWYEIDGKDGNCLCHEPLRVYKAIGCLETKMDEKFKLTSHVVFSFSVPECVLEEFPTHLVSEWFEEKVENKNWRRLFSSLHLEEENVTLPSVCL